MYFSWTKGVGLLLVVLASPAPVRAVVVAKTTANTARPVDDPGWDNVGIVRNSTGVYLGNRWVMTPAHVGAASILFPDLGTFEHDADSVIRLQNPPRPGLSDETDLLLFQLTEDPGLPPLLISQQSPPIGSRVIVIGNGKDRQEAATYWDVNDRPRDWVWTESDPPGDYSGFKTESSNTLRWGTNLIEDDELFGREFDDDLTTIVETTGDVVVLITEFDFDDGNSNTTVTADGEFITEFESQAVTNDSGGPLFFKNGDVWELAGIAVAVEGFNNQPNVVVTPVFGNLSFYADLATYQDQIAERFVFGDFDDDGELTAADVDLMTLATLADQYQPEFDLNRDGQLDLDDRAVWVEDVRRTSYGDANLDGEFNSQDLIEVFKAAEYEDQIEANSTWATGDWNGDLEFSTGDFVVALQSGAYELGPRESDLRSVGAVPEPSGLVLLGLAALQLLVRVRRCSAR